MAEEHVAFIPFALGIEPAVSDRVESAPCCNNIHDWGRLQDGNKTAHFRQLNRYPENRADASAHHSAPTAVYP